MNEKTFFFFEALSIILLAREELYFFVQKSQILHGKFMMKNEAIKKLKAFARRKRNVKEISVKADREQFYGAVLFTQIYEFMSVI